MLMEMKNASFKRAVKRTNYLNPPKSAAEFWVHQSLHQLKQAKSKPLWSMGAKLREGLPLHLLHVRLLDRKLGLSSTGKSIEFYTSVKLHGITIPGKSYLLMQEGPALEIFRVESIMLACKRCFLYLAGFGGIALDEYGSYRADNDVLDSPCKYSVKEVTAETAFTAVWCIQQEEEGEEEGEEVRDVRFIARW